MEDDKTEKSETVGDARQGPAQSPVGTGSAGGGVGNGRQSPTQSPGSAGSAAGAGGNGRQGPAQSPGSAGAAAGSGRQGPTPGAGGAAQGAGEEEPRLGDEGLPRSVRHRVEAMIPEIVKKTFAAGLGALFTTEEGIRRLAKDLSLPKDVAGYLAHTAGDAKDELLRLIAREVREFLESVNLSEEVSKMLTMLSFEIKTEIRFIPNDEQYGGVKPDVKARVGIKRADDRSRRRRRRRRRFRDEDTDTADEGEQTDDSDS
jgi:hypothetical protein